MSFNTHYRVFVLWLLMVTNLGCHNLILTQVTCNCNKIKKESNVIIKISISISLTQFSREDLFSNSEKYFLKVKNLNSLHSYIHVAISNKG